MKKYPKDCNPRKIGTKARAIFPNKLNIDNWEFHEMTGTDHGTDMIIEYIENEKFTNRKIECQIKGTATLENLKKLNYYSFSLDTKTINYALNSSIAFLLIVIDIQTENTYCIPIQDYFIANSYLYSKLENSQKSIAIRFDEDNLIDKYEDELKNLAKSTYIKDKGILKRI